jgi:hypothetical protein
MGFIPSSSDWNKSEPKTTALPSNWTTLATAARPTEKPAEAPLTGEWAADAWNSPTWKQAAHDHQARGGHVLVVETPLERLAQLRRLMGDDVALDAAWYELNDFRNRPTPKATVDAVVFAVRERRLAALREPANLERLSRCDAAARAEINKQIEKLGGMES